MKIFYINMFYQFLTIFNKYNLENYVKTKKYKCNLLFLKWISY